MDKAKIKRLADLLYEMDGSIIQICVNDEMINHLLDEDLIDKIESLVQNHIKQEIKNETSRLD